MFRTTLTYLLCGFLVAGPIPAWVHVASCDHHHHHALGLPAADADGHKEKSSGCSCSGHHLPESNAEPLALHFESSSEPAPGHDSDNCIICKSLANPNYGDSICLDDWREEPTVTDGLCLSGGCDISDHSLISNPRGPPVRV